MEHGKRSARRWRVTAILALGVVIGIVVAGTPAGAHIGTVTHLWNHHIKPKADVRYANAVPGTDKANNANKVDGIDSTRLRSAGRSALGTSFNSVGTTEETIASITVNVPAAGTLLVTAQGEWNNETAGNYIGTRLMEGTDELEFFDIDPGDVDTFYDQRQSHTVILSVSAGAHTYDWVGKTNSGTASVWRPQLIAVFIPGSLAPVARPVAKGAARPNSN